MDKPFLITLHINSSFGVDGKDLEEVVNLYNLNQEEKAILSQKDKRTWIIIYRFTDIL